MEDYEEYEEGGSSVNKVLVVVIVLLLLAIAAGCVYFFFIRKEPEPEDSNGVGYAMNAGVVLSQEELDAAMAAAAAHAAAGRVALSYKNGAYSSDGENFECYIVNSARNQYDMFLAMYADAELTDQVFLSGLIPPGSGYQELTLNRKLEKGTHTIYVVLTQVDAGEDGNESIVNQVSHTMDFNVS